MFMYFAIWLPLALPVQEPKAAPPAKTTNNDQLTSTKPAWTPKDREMVVLLGSAFIEQEARDGYLETELIRLFPNKDIRVRNLGWSGDTVHCQARSYFGPPQEGFDRLRGHLAMIKPTTVICCYGANESWKGESGIPNFRKGYEKLIDMIREATGATVVLMTPPRFEPLGPNAEGLRDASERLQRYWQEIKYVAEGRKCQVIEFGSAHQYGRTENGIDYTAEGYATAGALLWVHPSDFEAKPLTVDFEKGTIKSEQRRFSDISKQGNSLRWTQINDRLPWTALFGTWDYIKVGGDVKNFEVRIDGKLLKQRGNAILSLDDGPERTQREQLRQAIVKKNALFFHRWRPANETYLYGFRKHEQGNNGVEPPMFDKLVEQAEAEIAVLKKPVPHKYELIRVEK
jgi:hypothetical protein